MKKTWINFFSTQFLGVFNDNLLKNFICFIAVMWLPSDQKENVIALASALMVLPFILLSPLAGSLAERFKKARIYQWAKVAELPIVLIASTGFILESLPLVLVAMLLMGVQSALYSPAKYGLIKEYLGTKSTGSKLGVMELLSFSAVLVGTLVAGFVADIESNRTLILVGLMVFIAILGMVQSSFLKSKTPGVQKKTSTINPLAFLKQQHKLNKSSKGVNAAIFALGSFWFIASMIQMNLLIHCPEQLGLSASSTGIINALVAVGIGLGCFVSGRWNNRRVALGTLFFAALGMGVSLLVLAKMNSYLLFISVLMVLSFFGGLFKIPLNAWVQDKTSSDRIGQVLAYSNMVVFLSILISSVTFVGLSSVFSSSQVFIVIGILALIIALICLIVQPISSVRSLLAGVSKVLFRFKIHGQENIPSKGGIIACNHVSLLDALAILEGTKRNVRFVMHEAVYQNKKLNGLFKRCHMIPIASGKSKKVLAEFTARVKKEVDAGHLVCIFPEGQLSRTGQIMPFKKGIEKLAQEINAPILPMHLHNLVGTPFSFVFGKNKKYSFHPKNWKKRVYVNIGKQMKPGSTTFQVRQEVKELEIQNFSKYLQKKGSSIKLDKQLRLTCDGRGIEDINIKELKSLIVQSANVEVKDLMGRSVIYVRTKDDRDGKPLPGIHVEFRKGLNELCAPFEEGMLYVKSAYSDSVEWISTGVTGFMDECGFIKYDHVKIL
ncbi:MAG: acyl-[acyl-carrier-protein]-phospholipid O-acyltransferase [Glaciecola sp.]|jgi:acyl-[acyl-carrier-protein]-phospholipid O-acyltransferase/long-chain-fatty-acid--[acyl-carrier-protein] ligase